MLSAVFDTNVLVSTLISAGRPRELWNRVLEKKLQLVISLALLAEFDDVSGRAQFRRYVRRRSFFKFRRILLQNVRITRIKFHIDVITEDADDNAVLEAACNGKADYIVSGDSHLLELESFREIKIVNINEMLSILKQT